MRTSTTLLLTALAVLPGCGCNTAPADAVQTCQASQVLPGTVQTDILFVIDDSGSMSQEQTNLRNNLGVFIDTLAASAVKNDFRIGVTSSAVEDFTVNGSTAQAYANGPASGVPYPDGALVAVRRSGSGAVTPGDLVYDLAGNPATLGWGGPRILDSGDGSAATLAALTTDFKANVLLGTNGTGKEQPFRAARLALTDRLLDANKGFIRPGARLAIIIVTDEDDCSDTADPQRSTSNGQCHDQARKFADPPEMDRVEDFASFLFGPIDGELRDVTVGVIAGFSPSTADPNVLVPAMCSTAAGQAYDTADRYAALQANVGGARMKVGSICSATFADTLRSFAETLTPTSLPLEGAPADWRMLLVTLTKADGTQVHCDVAEEGSAAASDPATEAVYSPPRFGRPAQLSFQNGCALELGDRIDVRIVCVN